MQDLKPLEPGVMFWAERDTLEDVRALGVRCGQLCIPGGMQLTDEAVRAWKSEIVLVTVFAAYTGEDYADIPTVARTVGFVPPETRAERERRTLEISVWPASPATSGASRKMLRIPITSPCEIWCGASATMRPAMARHSRWRQARSRPGCCWHSWRM